jgi:carbon storage regulator
VFLSTEGNLTVLVLSRKQFEVIVIGNNIKVHLLDVRNGRVRIGIEAPKEIPVARAELVKEGK